MNVQTLSDWLDYISSLHPRDIDLGLERIAALAKSLSLTQFSCPVITVAGTNGKGSIVKFLESIYIASGYRVAAYTSPHILKFNERLRINGVAVSDDDLLAAFEFIEKARGDQQLSFFEFTTLAILAICQRLHLDVLLLEVGLGGRLDAVNSVDPHIAVISNIALDHTDWLGADRTAIAKEKAGIIRPEIPVICGDDDPPQTLLAAAQHNPFFCYGEDYKFEKQHDTWRWMGPNGDYLQLPVPQLKLVNAATSLMVVDQLQLRLPVTQFGIIQGLKKATLPGRFEQYRNIIFDVAHNPQATAYLAEQLCALPIKGRTLAVMGILKDKDIANVVTPLVPIVDQWYVGDLAVERGATGDEISAELTAQGVKNCYNFASVLGALKQARSACCAQDRLVIFGSFYTVAIAKHYINGLHTS